MTPEEASVIDLVDNSKPARATLETRSSLPTKFFSLQSHPFSDNVNPDFFYRTEAHEAAFIAMQGCIEDNVSLGLTTAVSGTGKTLLTQVLLQNLDPRRYKPALVLIYPRMSQSALLREICDELDIGITSKRPSTHELISAVQQRIMDLFLEGIKPVLIIDEVHFLAANNLQILRTLSNIETPQQKLLTILLFGEETFLEKLERPIFKSVLNRLFTRVELKPLCASEVEQYVKYRLLLVGGRPDLFAQECFEYLAQASRGVPREINRICHNALQIAASRQQKKIDVTVLKGIPH